MKEFQKKYKGSPNLGYVRFLCGEYVKDQRAVDGGSRKSREVLTELGKYAANVGHSLRSMRKNIERFVREPYWMEVACQAYSDEEFRLFDEEGILPAPVGG